MEQMNNFFIHYFNVLLDYSPKVISAIIILFVGIWGIRFIRKIAETVMTKRELEPTLIKFLLDFLIWALRILLFVSVISKLGIETSSFVAILGAIGLAVGLSLQGSLSNFAGGVLIILFKPFKVGDTIEAQSENGKVLGIQIFSTKILTAQNQIIYIPNGLLSNGKIKNFSQKTTRRTSLVVPTGYDSDIKNIKIKLEALVKNHPKVLQTPAPEVVISDMGEKNLIFSLRAWTYNADYGTVCSELLEESSKIVKVMTS